MLSYTSSCPGLVQKIEADCVPDASGMDTLTGLRNTVPLGPNVYTGDSASAGAAFDDPSIVMRTSEVSAPGGIISVGPFASETTPPFGPISLWLVASTRLLPPEQAT
jgi:hypothetical protein